ncbi:Demethylsterigmatocystin 6-O-methyltransferase [Lachnellula suecica]|uniref:Demethylsterigmatocystin 6-O-methyltransferase n=1 Tax=Lachnellula suecica TaxID=602035 RepID=A0A8T9CAA7_9HELO|nr:Demethylsterigmatocystin 6-O-methyltransferase [Lachnellula suecica]
MELKLFDHVASSESPKTAAELAGLTGADKQLIIRFLRPLTAKHFFAETGYETYASTPTTKFLTTSTVTGGFKFMSVAPFPHSHPLNSPGSTKPPPPFHTPAYLSNTTYANPTGPNGPFQSAFSTEPPMFPWLMQHPRAISNSNDLMAGQRMSRVDWFDFATPPLFSSTTMLPPEIRRC